MTNHSITISLVAAMASNRVIGDGPNIPWRISGEQRIFRRLTEGNVVVKGRRTHESIGKVLPNRTPIVITRRIDYASDGCLVAPDLETAVDLAAAVGTELFIGGGAEIYSCALPIADRIYLTEIHREFRGGRLLSEVLGPRVPAP